MTISVAETNLKLNKDKQYVTSNRICVAVVEHMLCDGHNREFIAQGLIDLHTHLSFADAYLGVIAVEQDMINRNMSNLYS